MRLGHIQKLGHTIRYFRGLKREAAQLVTLCGESPLPQPKRAAGQYRSAMTIKSRGPGMAVAFLLCFACGRTSEVVRPAEVPSEATYVLGGKFGGWWQRCISATGDQALRCSIWNGAGLVLVNEEFMPYDGGAPPSAYELKISTDPAIPSGPDRVFLSNGRVLLPRSRFVEMKIFVDWLEGKK